MIAPPAYDLVVVAGGSGRRIGGAVKADLALGGERLLDRVLTATDGASTRVLVGAGIAVPDDVVVTLEDPPAGGPAAGTAAGLRAVGSPAPWTLLLAGDLADPAEGIARLLAAAGEADDRHSGDGQVDGICLAGEADHPQWLFGIHRTEALRDAVTQLGTVRDRSMKALLSPLRLQTVAVDPDTVADIDTHADYERWRSATGHLSRPPRKRDDEATVERWARWAAIVSDELGTDVADVDIVGIHVLTKQIAHGYDRPLAPVSSYILGLAVGAARARGDRVDQTELRRAIVAATERAPRVPGTEERS